MRTTAEQRRQAEQRIRAAADALLRGDIPPDGKCDVTTLARQAGISRAALYRTYPHLKEEFEKRLTALRASGDAPDPRDAQVTRLKTQNDELKLKLAARDTAIRDLEQFRELALSRLAAQHDEITRLRRQATPARVGNVRTLAPRPPGHAAGNRQPPEPPARQL
jgi:phage shock protein A